MLTQQEMGIFHEFYIWWQGLKANGEATPHVDKFDPAAAGDLEHDMVLLERLPSGAFATRHWGDNLAKVTVDPVNFDDFLERFNYEDAEILGQHMFYVTGRPCGGVMQRDVVLPDGRRVLVNHFGLPLKSDHGVVRHIAVLGKILRIIEGGRKRSKALPTINAVAYIDLGRGIPASEQEVDFEASLSASAPAVPSAARALK